MVAWVLTRNVHIFIFFELNFFCQVEIVRGRDSHLLAVVAQYHCENDLTHGTAQTHANKKTQ